MKRLLSRAGSTGNSSSTCESARENGESVVRLDNVSESAPSPPPPEAGNYSELSGTLGLGGGGGQFLLPHSDSNRDLSSHEIARLNGVERASVGSA